MIVEFIDNSEEVKSAMHDALIRALEKIGMTAEKYAKRLCPVDTGALRNTIAFKVEPDEQAVYVGSNSEYAVYVELGTGEYSEVGGTQEKRWTYRDELTGETRIGVPQKPRHFIKPAVTDHGDTFRAIMHNALSKGD